MTATFDATDDSVVQCPYPHYREMRDQSPVLELDGAPFGRPGEQIYAVSRYEDVKRILHEPGTFSSRFGTPAAKPSPELVERLREVIAEGWPNVPTMLTEDAPTHTRYRRLVSMAFTPKRVNELEPAIRSICTELVDGFGEAPTGRFPQLLRRRAAGSGGGGDPRGSRDPPGRVQEVGRLVGGGHRAHDHR